ncbi:MAG: DUF6320 domain-containing protein [Lachnospiraceae bacterium]
MLYCSKCKVKIRTSHKTCPLCQGGVSGFSDEKDHLFPEIKERKHSNLYYFELFTFLCIAISVISIILDILITPQAWWSFYLSGGVFCVWILVAVGIMKRRNLMKNAMWQMVLLSIVAIVWDVTNGWNRWSIDYFLPFAIIITLIAMIVITIINQLTSPEYMIYFIMAACTGLIPIILLLTNRLTVTYPTIICVGCCVLLITALLIFQRKSFVNEMIKKLHL